MNQVIINAIQNKQLLAFTYDGHQRTVEPHTYGVTTKGKEAIRAYQVSGSHVSSHGEPWHLFSVSKIVGLSNTGQTFTEARQGYKRPDSAMQSIYAQL